MSAAPADDDTPRCFFYDQGYKNESMAGACPYDMPDCSQEVRDAMMDSKQLVCIRSPRNLPHGYDDANLCPNEGSLHGGDSFMNAVIYVKGWNEWSERVYCLRTKKNHVTDTHQGCAMSTAAGTGKYEMEAPSNVMPYVAPAACHCPCAVGDACWETDPCCNVPTATESFQNPWSDDNNICYYIKETGVDEAYCGG